MYPGYSPANHDYGKAAEEYGIFATASRAQGADVTHPDLHDEIGQARGTKRKASAGVREATNVKQGGPDSRDAGETAGGSKPKPMTPSALHFKNQAKGTNITEETLTSIENLGFVIDVNPTPVNINGLTARSPKRSASSLEPLDQEKSKKAKNKHKGNLPHATVNQGIEFEDISQEVDARMREKEAKRKRKGEKKRKREPADFSTAPAEPSAAAEVDRPKQKKSRKNEDNVLVDRSISKKRHGTEDEEGQEESGKKKRKKNKERI